MSSPTKAAPVANTSASKAGAVSAARVPRLQRQCSCGGSCDSCRSKSKQTLQRKAVSGAPAPAPRAAQPRTAQPKTTPVPKAAPPPKPAPLKPPSEKVPPIVQRVLDTPGQPLDPATKSDMEARFGRSLEEVRVHTGTQAAESARAVDAHAYTVGQHIVFDAGQYQPKTPEGRRLLAHELAHTVQQHGLQKSADVAMDTSSEYHRLEREAERFSEHAMRQGSPQGPRKSPPPPPQRADRPTLSRAKKTQTATQEAAAKKDNKDQKDTWADVDETSELGKAGVAKISHDKADATLVAVVMRKPFMLPGEKGPAALPLWRGQADAGHLQAIISPGTSEAAASTGLKQERPNTDDLRDRWLAKLGWNPANEEDLWKQAVKEAGVPDKDTSFRPTKAGGQTCDIDHILELQFGGNNIPQNMQVLDSSPNRSSGSQIGAFLRQTALEVRGALAKEAPDPGTANEPKPDVTGLRLEYKSVDLVPYSGACICCKVEEAARKLKLTDKQKGGSEGVPFPMKSGPFSVCVSAGDNNKVQLADSSTPANKYASTLIPGLRLLEWERPAKATGQPTCEAEDAAAPDAAGKTEEGAGKKSPAGAKKPAAKGISNAGGTVSAALDPTSRILKLLKFKDGEKTPSVKLARDPSGHLAAPDKDPKIAFAIDYLSEGVIHELKIRDDGSVSGSGTLVPTVPFLPKPIHVAFDKDSFVMTTDVKKPELPIPGVTITESKIGLQFAPEFKPFGKVGFELAPGGRKILHGTLTVSADENGILVNGDVFATIPGVDEAKGNLTLKNKEWSGGVEIKAGDFGGKLKYIKQGQVSIKFAGKTGIDVNGQVELNVPGVSNPVIANVSYDHQDGWKYSGEAVFNPPRIKPVKIDLEYAKGHLSGTGTTGFTFHNLDGDLTVHYKDEQLSGDAVLKIKTKRAEGTLKVKMRSRLEGDPVFSGEGSVTFQVTPNLVATAGIKIDEHEKVRFDGELSFPKPIDLFDGFHGNYDIFKIRLPIPIPGASIGGVGINAVITGALSAGYDVGPIQLLDTKAKANFQPLEENPELEMDLTSRLHIHASVHVTGSISGDIELDLKLAAVRGGLTVTATAELADDTDLSLAAHYKDGKIQADIDFHTLLALMIYLGLSAHVEAEAGIGWLKVTTGKEWQLASFKYDPGLKFGMKLKNPIHYATGEGLKLPSIDDIEWIKPDIDTGAMLDKIFHHGEKPEHEAR